MAGEDWEARFDAIVRNSGIPIEYDARPGHERYSRGVVHMSPRPRSADAKAEWARVLLKELARAHIRGGK